MADAQRTIDLIFNGVDKTGAAVQSALKNTGQFAGGVESATQPIADFTAGALKFEAGILAAGTAITAFSLKVASDFQSAALDLQKVLSDTDPALETFTDRARELSVEYGVASTEVLQSMANFKQAGFTAEEAATLTKNALDLVIAGGVEASTGSDLLVASIKGFGAEAADAATIIDLLNGVSNEYATNLGELLTGFARVSPVAKVAGLSLEETVGILTPGIEVFRSGSEVSNALRTSLLRLVDDTKPVQQGLAALGVAQEDANGQLRSARDIYFDVATAFQSLDDKQKVFIASQLVGIDQSAKFIAMTEGLDKTLRITGDGFDYLGSASEEVKVRLQSAEVQVDRTVSAFTDMALSIGAPLLDEFTDVSKALTQIFQAIGASAADENGLGQLVVYVETLMKDLESTVEQAAKNLPAALEGADFSAFREGIDAVVGSLKNLFDDIDFTSVDGLRKAIEITGQAFLGLSNYTAGVIDAFKPLFDLLTDAAGGLDGLDMSWARDIGELAGYASQLNMAAGALSSMVVPLQALAGIFIAKQGLSLASGIGAVTSALAGSGGLFTIALNAANVAGVGAATYAIASLANELTERATGGTSISTWLADVFTAGNDLDKQARALTETVKVAREEVEKPPEKNGIDQALEDIIVTAEKITPELFSEPLQEIEVSAKRVEDAFKSQKSSVSDIIPVYDEVTGKIIGYTDGISDADQIMGYAYESSKKVSEGLKEVGESADEMRVLSEEAFVKLEEIASNERIKNIEARVTLNVAGLEAETERVNSAFDSINTTIESTGSLLDSLFGNMAGASGLREKFAIERQIEEENRRRDEALKKQNELTDAQIEAIRARALAIQQGDAMIKVDGAGLQPHLEAFMWEILEAIQVRVNQEGLETLFG